MSIGIRITLAGAVVAAVGLALTFDKPVVETVQLGYRGTGMQQVVNPARFEAAVAASKVPDAIPPVPPGGEKASVAYKNVKVLTEISADELARTMVAITEWVSPEQGCAYCHKDGEDLSEDTLYTKVVARRMLEMTRQINGKWQAHVGGTGVTCFTCHRGQPVPAFVWHADPGPRQALGAAGSRAGQNAPAAGVGLTSLPYDPLSQYLRGKDGNIRVVSATALPESNRTSIKQTEGTYGLMMHLSEALGVNCTFCHNSQSFTAWDKSSPRRATAWQGIQMVRELNDAFLEPLGPTYPKDRLGPHGDAPKANCATCHQGAYKPLFGASMLKDHPELVGPRR
ncbi:MAG: photosynthetic reaction center cytochrome c subunit [Rubrivivax sp.]|nr:photosynthetic reaction center cytochrome c subunit [Rubrivivax sp.]